MVTLEERVDKIDNFQSEAIALAPAPALRPRRARNL
jgi:hypothetical protein